MTAAEAHRLIHEYYRQSAPTEEDDHVFLEALTYLIRTLNDADAMLDLGSWYYEKREFTLAAKYCEMAFENGNRRAADALGYIWYYGRTGVTDYEKAYRYYSVAAFDGNREAAYKVGDMYHYGYYVEKDETRYREIIEGLYKEMENEGFLYGPVPSVCMRLARIRREEGRTDEAVRLYERSRAVLEARLALDPFFGNITNMKNTVEELYELKKPDAENLDLYDLFILLRTPHTVTFRYRKQRYEVESVEESGRCVIRFGTKWYRTPEEFFKKAAIGDQPLMAAADRLYAFEVK